MMEAIEQQLNNLNVGRKIIIKEEFQIKISI